MGKNEIFIGADHAGFKLKGEIKKFLDAAGYKYHDLGVFSDQNPSDYPGIAFKLASEVAQENGKGILVCGTGTGEAIVANKVKGIRAANCFDEYTAKMSREHNDSNVLCMGARTLSGESAKKILEAWLNTPFSSDERHARRIAQIGDIEKKVFK